MSESGCVQSCPTNQGNFTSDHVEVADGTKVLHRAVARIDGETLVVESENVTAPVAAEVDPLQAYLYNAAGLLAAPFCYRSVTVLLPFSAVELRSAVT